LAAAVAKIGEEEEKSRRRDRC